MRDLQADLEICNKATPGPWEATSESDEDVRVCQIENEECVCCLALMGDYNWEKEEWKEGSIKQWNKDAEFIAASREGWPEAIERAIKAEDEVERLQTLLETLNGECIVCDSVSEITKVQAELAQLRKVADAARGVFLGEGEYLCSEFRNDIDRLRQALTELDKEPFNG